MVDERTELQRGIADLSSDTTKSGTDQSVGSLSKGIPHGGKYGVMGFGRNLCSRWSMWSLWRLGDAITTRSRQSLEPPTRFALVIVVAFNFLVSATLLPSDESGPLLRGGGCDRCCPGYRWLTQSALRR